MTQQERGERFRALHAGKPFVIPNPWDAGSARMLEALGFKALATTSSGFAFTRGKLDGDATLDEIVEHVGVMCAATSLPVAVDLENCYGAPAEAITRVAEAGAVGGSIEDYDRDTGIVAIDEAAERVAAAVAAARALDFPFMLAARAENHLHGVTDLDDTIARLQAYEAAGADVLYAPGLREIDQVRAICSAVSKPVNVLGHAGFTMAELFEAGAQRVSVGGALTWVGVAAAADAAQALRDGDLSVLTARVPLGEWFRA
jgi:2-methylisocitrate lyase-like PEP mutase family enzyme